MPALTPRLHSPSPGRAPASRQSCPAWEGNSERSHWSSPSVCGGRFFQGFQPGCHLLLLFHPWWSSIRTAQRCVAHDCVFVLSLDQPLAVFSDKQTAGVSFRAPLGNQPNMKFSDQLVGGLLVVADAVNFLHSKRREAERVIFRRFKRPEVEDRCNLLVLNLSDHIVLFDGR